MESEEQAAREQRNVAKVPATLGLIIGAFLVIAAIAGILIWAL
jgi:hypothetical protein